MTAPRVTIGIPVHNGERYLAAAVDSLLAQDFADFELLIADNGSTDETLGIAAEAAGRDDRVTVHASPVNRGAAWNYNRLVDLASGEYFKWAAHDDLVRPSFLSRCVEVLDRDPGVVLAYTRAIGFGADGRVVREYSLRPYAAAGAASVRARSILLDPSPCYESFGVVRTAQLRRTARIGAYTSSDRTLLLELALSGRFHEIPEVLFLHRLHEDRSVQRYSDDRARNAWFDPTWVGRASMPRWRLGIEYVRAISRAPVDRSEKFRTSTLLLWWAAANRGALLREAGRRVVSRGTTVPAEHTQKASQQ